MSDAMMMALMVFGATLVLIAFLTTILHYFVALRSRPTQRAAWTSGVAYILAALASVFGSPAGYELWAPLVPIPAALIAFWFWRVEFRRAWIEDPELAPDGTIIEDDDVASGLLKLALVIVIGLGVAFIRLAIKGAFGSL